MRSILLIRILDNKGCLSYKRLLELPDLVILPKMSIIERQIQVSSETLVLRFMVFFLIISKKVLFAMSFLEFQV